jgi:S-adenosylmethionine:tRNA ribosyltransferase-isomerase
MRTDLFDFDLPEDRIALRPAEPRDSARLLVVDPNGTPPLTDRTVRDLADILRPGDALVLNDTRVIPAALSGVRVRGDLRSGVSFNLLRRVDASRWRALARPAKRLAVGDRVRFGSESESTACLLAALEATVAARLDAGEVELLFDLAGPDLDLAIQGVGEMPLPPYIAGRRAPDARDRVAYQTVYAERDGAVAAPTAGLHFTPELFAALTERGVSRHFVTLHVGAGTFLPVKVDDTRAHKMHAEWGEVSENTARALAEVRAAGGRIVAVGTTSLRILESAAGAAPSPGSDLRSLPTSPPSWRSHASHGRGEVQVRDLIRPFVGETDIFITPGYRFRAVDVLMTNFHLPRSTLFMLVSAFSGLDTMKMAYAHAVASGYRFYSYGDASLLFRADKEADHG